MNTSFEMVSVTDLAGQREHLNGQTVIDSNNLTFLENNDLSFNDDEIRKDILDQIEGAQKSR